MLTVATIHEQLLDAVIRRHDFDYYRSLLHPEYTYTGADGIEHPGPNAGVAVAQTYTNAFADLEFELTALHVDELVVVAEFTCRGTHTGELEGMRPTGKRTQLKICNVIEMRDGKVYREREYYDVMSLMTQLGLIGAAVNAAAV